LCGKRFEQAKEMIKKEDLSVIDGETAYGDTPMTAAVVFGLEEMVELMIKRGASVDKQNRDNDTPLALACLHLRSGVAKILLENGANVNCSVRGKSVLCVPAGAGHVELVKMLLEHGAEVNSDWCKPPLHWAAQNANLETLKILINFGAQINCVEKYQNSTALGVAVKAGHVEIVKMLIGLGADVNLPVGSSPLSHAVSLGHKELVKVLIGINNITKY
jgi:uncharacterized protein